LGATELRHHELTLLLRYTEDVHKPRKSVTEMKNDLYYYFKNNIWITTSGDFHTPSMKFVGEQVGFDRLMFSAD
jgi:2,3-dihydroxybenzoate decarboxylase